jgi:hypothetical protein
MARSGSFAVAALEAGHVRHEPTFISCNGLCVAAAAGAALLLSAAPLRAGEAAPPGADGGGVEKRLDDLERSQSDLKRAVERLDAPTRSAVEDYLDDRGITGPAWTDAELTPLDRVLRRVTLGAALRLRYEEWANLVDLDEGSRDRADFLETRARLALGFVLAGGSEIDLELQGLLPAGGLSEGAPSDAPTSSVGALDPAVAFEGDEVFELRRAGLKLPGVNLFGRLAHVPVTFVLGRQELALGSGFLLGREGNGRGLCYDGARLVYESGKGERVDLFWGKEAGDPRAIAARLGADLGVEDVGAEVAGVAVKTPGLLPYTLFEACFVSTRAGPGAGGFPSTRVDTLGLSGSWDLTTRARLRVEAAAQRGRSGAERIRHAYAGEAVLEWRVASDLETGPNPWRGSVFLAYATGDDPGTGRIEGFFPVAQDSVGRWEDTGLLASRNAAVWGLRAARSGQGGAEVGISFAQAFAPEKASPAGLIFRKAAGPGDKIGDFVALHAGLGLFGEREGRLRISYTRFWPGDYFEAAADPADRLAVEVTMGF